MASIDSSPRSVEDIFKDYKARRSAEQSHHLHLLHACISSLRLCGISSSKHGNTIAPAESPPGSIAARTAQMGSFAEAGPVQIFVSNHEIIDEEDGRKATLREVVSHILEQWRLYEQKRY